MSPSIDITQGIGYGKSIIKTWGKYDETIKDYDEVIRINPNDTSDLDHQRRNSR